MENRPAQPQGLFAEVLRPLALSIRQRRSTIRPVSQVTLTLANNNSKDNFEAARTICLKWLANRAGRRLPDSAWEGKSFELDEVGAQRGGAVGIDSPRYWAARLDDADKNIAQRTWVTEIGLGRTDDLRTLFGARLICVTRGEDATYERTIPGFVRPIIENIGAVLDDHILSQNPWLVATAEDVDALVSLILRPSREADVVVFALPEDSIDPGMTAAPAYDVHRATLGAAHVVILTGPASFHLTDRIGREFSVFRQGVRTYLAGFNPNQDQPFRHPLGLPERIANWPGGGASSYARMLISYALGRTVGRPDREGWLPSYSDVRRIATKQHLDQTKAQGTSDKDMLALVEDYNAQLRKELVEQKKNSDQLFDEAVEERNTALQQAQQARARADALRRQVQALESRLSRIDGKPIEIPVPPGLEDFDEWCQRHLTGHVELHNRAFQGIKRSQYQDEGLIYRALILLRNFYVPMRRQPSDDARRAYQTECQALGLEESGSITDSRLGEQGETYIVNYDGQKRILDRHLKHGTSKDPRFCFRLYFFWDETSDQAVVGWLPSHLDTRQT
ncbi:MAG: hypothetical protein AB7Q97_18630 [Gammaproteobacteria bacterium]